MGLSCAEIRTSIPRRIVTREKSPGPSHGPCASDRTRVRPRAIANARSPRSTRATSRRVSIAKVDMAKVPARLRSVTYSLSPMRTGVMHGLFKDWASGMATRVKENAVDAGVFCALPLGATVWCVEARRRRRETVTRRRRDDDDATHGTGRMRDRGSRRRVAGARRRGGRARRHDRERSVRARRGGGARERVTDERAFDRDRTQVRVELQGK